MLLPAYLREANKEDADQIYRLIVQLTEKEMDKPYFISVFERNLMREDIFYWVVISKERILGFISLHLQELLHHQKKVAEVQELCVDEKHRGSGTGKVLLQRAIEEAKKQNCELIELAASKKRENAHRFYEREGWERSHFKFTKKL